MPFDFVILDLCPIKSTAYTRLSISVPEINTMHLVKILLYSGGQFYWSRELEYPVNVTDLSYVTGKLYQIMLYRVHIVTCGNHNISIMGTDLLGRCKSRSMRKRHR